MTGKQAVRIAADVLMTLALLFLMGYHFWGDAAHEWVGAGMFALFILHHVLNASWHRRLFQGKYTPRRVLTLCVDVLLLLAMLALMYSGIVMSRHVFAFLPVTGGMVLARRLHILGAYWGYLLTGLHLGLHWSMILGMIRRRVQQKPSRAGKTALFLLSAAVAAYGLFVFFSRDLPACLFLQNEFVFLDYGESKLRFYLDYLALTGLCVFLAHYGSGLLRGRKENRE